MPGDTLAAMPNQETSPLSDHSEEGRPFLQARVALFWKVIFSSSCWAAASAWLAPSPVLAAIC
jgi:hypothetical protein